jgi:hypothetical protein
MTNYKLELEKAITGANDLMCAVSAISTGETADADYTGALRVLAQGIEAHARDLEAMRLCMSWEDKAREAKGGNNALLDQIFNDYTDTAAELSGYVEILNSLQTEICQFDGSESQAERISAQDSLYSLWRSVARFKDAQDAQMDSYAKRRKSETSAEACNKKPSPAITDRDAMCVALDCIRDTASHFIGSPNDVKGMTAAFYFIEQTVAGLSDNVHKVK